MTQTNFTRSQLSSATILKKSKWYQSEGYQQANRLGRKGSDYSSHLFAYFIDFNIGILPVYLWAIEFLLILTGWLPPHFFDLLFYLMFALLFVTCVMINAVMTAHFQGQTIGMMMTGLRLVKRNKKLASPFQVVMRQVLGFGLPIVILGFFFQVFGILLWWLINGIVVMIMPHQESLFDLFFGTCLVNEPNVHVVYEPSQTKKVSAVQVACPIDLQVRSNLSTDGQYDVETLFKLAKQKGIHTLSITDHNCARANGPALRLAQLYDIRYIPGVEIDAQYNRSRVRILAYYIDWQSSIFEVIEREAIKRDKQMSLERVEKFERYAGIRIDTDSLMASARYQTITKEDITRMVFNNQRVRQMPFAKRYLDRFGDSPAMRQQFMKDVFGPSGPCYVTANYPEVKEVIRAIHMAGGLAVLAYWNMAAISPSMIQQFVSLGLDGLQCFGPKDGRHTKELLKIAKGNQLFVTNGSNFHGQAKPEIDLGQANTPDKALSLVDAFCRAA